MGLPHICVLTKPVRMGWPYLALKSATVGRAIRSKSA